MADKSQSADSAYDRAVAAFQQGSYDVSRQWVLEALAQDGSHARARALLSRLDAVRRPSGAASGAPPPRPDSFARSTGSTPEVVSTDPTVLITRASRGPVAQPLDPTIVVRRDDVARKRQEDDPFASQPPRSGGFSEPTIVVERSKLPPQSRASAPAPREAAGGAALGWREGWFGRRSAAPARPLPVGSLRGVGVVVAAVAAAALLLFAGIAAFRWLWPAGQQITLTRPTGGTLIGPGLQCGTRGTDCTTTRPTGDVVQVTPEPDDGYVWSGFTGDCAPNGRITMAAARTCGAIFNKVAAAQAAVTFPLEIIKPSGGTIVGAGDLLCGTNGSACTANVPSGEHVVLRPSADNGYTFGSFTGDCSLQGETTMSAARTCGATFIATQSTVANRDPGERPIPLPRPLPAKPATDTSPPVPPPAPPVAAPAPAPAPAPDTSQGTPSQGPVDKPQTAEEHAQKEIELLVNNYCESLETLEPKRVQKWFPLAQMDELRDEFRQYKTLRCTITAPPKYDRLDATGAGGAQVKFGMKQEIQMRSGGAPVVLETIVTMVTSRPNFQSPWLIDRVRHDPKPKN